MLLKNDIYILVEREHVWSYINVLRREEAKYRVIVQQTIIGKLLLKKRHHIPINQRILAIVAKYNDRDYIDYLRELAHYIELAT